MEQLVPMLGMLIFVLILYILIVRPQRKKEERRALMVASVKKGSVIYAAGGIRCTVLELRPGSVLTESAPARSRLEIDADSIEDVEGFDWKSERERQKSLRQSRAARGSSGQGPRLR